MKHPEPNTLHLVVVTKNRATGTIESRKVIDHENRDDRVWLGRHCYWAFRNGRSVETYAEETLNAEREFA